jgi:hypothetical protein
MFYLRKITALNLIEFFITEKKEEMVKWIGKFCIKFFQRKVWRFHPSSSSRKIIYD